MLQSGPKFDVQTALTALKVVCPQHCIHYFCVTSTDPKYLSLVKPRPVPGHYLRMKQGQAQNHFMEAVDTQKAEQQLS